MKSLKSPCFCLRSQAEYPHIPFVLPIGDEFRERIAFRGTHEKFGKCLAQRVCNDKLRWRDAGTNGSEAGAERVPNELGRNDGEILEQSLGDNASLYEDISRVPLCVHEAKRNIRIFPLSCRSATNFARESLSEEPMRNSGSVWRNAFATTNSDGGMPGRMVRSQDPNESQTSLGETTARYWSNPWEITPACMKT